MRARTPAAASAQAPQVPRRASFGSALLLISSVALVGETAIHRVYGSDVVAQMVLLAGVLLAGLVLGGAHRRPPAWAVVVSGLLGVLVLAVAPPLKYVISHDWLLIGVLVLAAATVVPALLPLVWAEHAGWVVVAGLALAATGYGLVVLGSTPVIDVWELLQGAGRGLAEGRNPYELAFPASPPGAGRRLFHLPACHHAADRTRGLAGRRRPVG